jgi:hypothetical protein
MLRSSARFSVPGWGGSTVVHPSSGTLLEQSVASLCGVLSSKPERWATAVVVAMSIATLPVVRTMSGIVSTASSTTKGSIGSPIARQIGAMEVIKVIDPGRLTAPRVVVAAAATQPQAMAGVKLVLRPPPPYQWAA